MASRLGGLCPTATPCNPCGCEAPKSDSCSHSSSSVPAQPILHRVCTLSKGNILHVVCGGTPLSLGARDPCDRTAQPSDGEGDACRHPPPHKSPLTLRHGCRGTEDNILHVGCGGTSPFYPYHHLPPSTAAIPDHGRVSAMLLVSVQGVILIPLHGDCKVGGTRAHEICAPFLGLFVFVFNKQENIEEHRRTSKNVEEGLRIPGHRTPRSWCTFLLYLGLGTLGTVPRKSDRD